MTVLCHCLQQLVYVAAVMKQLQNRTTRRTCDASSDVFDPECAKGRTLNHVNQYHYRSGEALRVPGG